MTHWMGGMVVNEVYEIDVDVTFADILGFLCDLL